LSFAWDIIVPADTAEASPKEQTLQITYGVITRVDVHFPQGCHSLVKVRLTKGKLFGILPTNPDEWITGDGATVSYRMNKLIDDKPYELDFTACSPNTSYQHRITIRIEMLPEEVATPWQVMRDFVQLMSRLMGV